MNNKPKTLVILSPGFPDNEADTTCIPPQQVFVNALKKANPQLNIIVLAFEYPFRSANYQWHGVNVISFGSKNNWRLSRLYTTMRVPFALKKIDKEYQITGLLSFWFGKCAVAGQQFAAKRKLPHFCWLLGQDARPGNKYVHKIKLTSTSLIALSDFIAREFNNNYGVTPAHVIPVGVDVSLFGRATDDRDIDVLGVGSLIPLKQYDMFLEVVQTLKTFLPNLNAVICGDGPEMDSLREMAKQMNLEKNVLMPGKLMHKEVLALMQRSKTLMHPSAYEGFGAVCAEALYAGAHVVSFVRPMDAPVKNWDVAADKMEMAQILLAKLQDITLNHDAVLPYSIEANAAAMLKLFNYQSAAMGT